MASVPPKSHLLTPKSNPTLNPNAVEYKPTYNPPIAGAGADPITDLTSPSPSPITLTEPTARAPSPVSFTPIQTPVSRPVSRPESITIIKSIQPNIKQKFLDQLNILSENLNDSKYKSNISIGGKKLQFNQETNIYTVISGIAAMQMSTAFSTNTSIENYSPGLIVFDCEFEDYICPNKHRDYKTNVEAQRLMDGLVSNGQNIFHVFKSMGIIIFERIDHGLAYKFCGSYKFSVPSLKDLISDESLKHLGEDLALPIAVRHLLHPKVHEKYETTQYDDIVEIYKNYIQSKLDLTKDRRKSIEEFINNINSENSTLMNSYSIDSDKTLIVLEAIRILFKYSSVLYKGSNDFASMHNYMKMYNNAKREELFKTISMKPHENYDIYIYNHILNLLGISPKLKDSTDFMKDKLSENGIYQKLINIELSGETVAHDPIYDAVLTFNFMMMMQNIILKLFAENNIKNNDKNKLTFTAFHPSTLGKFDITEYNKLNDIKDIKIIYESKYLKYAIKLQHLLKKIEFEKSI